MDIFGAFICFALGMATDAIYNHIRKGGEYEAYKDGQRQARKEEQIRIDTEEKVKTEYTSVPAVNPDAYVINGEKYTYPPEGYHSEDYRKASASRSYTDDWNAYGKTLTRVK